MGSTTSVQVTFTKPVAGLGKKRTFIISYDDTNIATRTGEVWEISVPRIGNESSYRNYNLTLIVPDTLGKEAYISPYPESSQEVSGNRVYNFSKENIKNTGISAGFGQFQVFSFTLNYHLENTSSFPSTTEVALPPDTATQKVYYKKVDPNPNYTYTDKDGNWMAQFTLNPHQRLDITASGEVQIFASARHLFSYSPQELFEYTLPTQYWQSDNEKIKKLAEELKTPEAIYNYVSTNLKYNYNRVNPNAERYGALKALDNPNDAICMEFTDLFIAIARAAGIPAREINGYAYTENPSIQPLSLVADVLHSWPEYWDTDKGTWIPIDPTWASTTHGVDFFNKLDLRHFAFVIHGTYDSKPYSPGSYKLGNNPQKDVYVSFGQLDKIETNKPTINYSFSSLPIFTNTIKASVQNNGPYALYNLNPQISYDGKTVSLNYVASLPPYGRYDFQKDFSYGLLGSNSPNIVTINAANEEVKIVVVKNTAIIYQLVIILIGLIGTFFLLHIILVKVRFKNVFKRLFTVKRHF